MKITETAARTNAAPTDGGMLVRVAAGNLGADMFGDLDRGTESIMRELEPVGDVPGCEK